MQAKLFTGCGRLVASCVLACGPRAARVRLRVTPSGNTSSGQRPISTRTYVYARLLPNGSLEADVTIPDEEKRHTIVLREITPHALGVYEVRYSGPQQVRTLRHLHRELDPGKGFTRSR